jgi:Flp pilus assembly protein TadD
MEINVVTMQQAADGQISVGQLLDIQKREIEILAALGMQLYQQGQLEDARTIFTGLVALDGNVHYGYAGLGAMALIEQQLDDAVRWLTRATELNPADPAIYANLGEALLRQENFKAAAAAFEAALKLDPTEKNPGANRARGILVGMQNLIQEHQRVQSGKAAD